MATEPATADPHALLEHATWLRRLALSLVRDAAAADDLVQETWIAALRRPPRDDRPLRPWLRRVIENAARFRWRGDRNRGVREADTAALAEEATPSPDQLLVRHEAQQMLARLVSELEEPFRTTVLLCYGEGLSPKEVARRLGIPAGTVRWRLKTALDRLRERLDETHGGDRRPWMLALTPLAMADITPGAASTAGSTNGVGASKTAGVWSSPLLPMALVALLVAVVVIVARSSQPDRDDSAQRVVAAASLPAARVGGSPESARDAAMARVAAIAADRPPGWIAQEGVAPRRIAGRVVDDGEPVAGALVRLTSELSLLGMMPALERRTDRDGRFDFGVHVARPYALGAAKPDRLAALHRIDLRDPAARSDEIELALAPCTAIYYGKVVDVNGSPIAHAQLLREDVIGTEAGDDGSFEICVMPSAVRVEQLQVVVRADGYGTAMLESTPPGRMRRDIVLAPEGVIAGGVIDEHGAIVAGAKIWIERDLDRRLPPSEQSATLFAVTDAGGRFRLDGVHGGRLRIAGAARGMTAQPQTIVVAAGVTHDVTVRMGATGIVRGRVMKGGLPVAGAHVRVKDGFSETAVSQRDGSFILDRVPVGETRFLATPFVVKTPESIEVVAGDERAVVLEVAPQSSIFGTVRRNGVPVPYARVNFSGPTPVGTNSDRSGRYRVDGLRAGAYGYYADDARRDAYVSRFDLVIGEAEQRQHDLDLVAGARITGVVVDGHGKPVAEAVVAFAGERGDEGICISGETGAFTCAQMDGGGPYVPGVFAGNDRTVPFAFVGDAPAPVVLADGNARVDGVRLVVDPRRLTIRGRVVDASGMPLADARVHAWGEGGRHDRWTQAPSGVTDADGNFVIASLAPGAYALEVAAVDAPAYARRVVDAGASDVELVVERPSCIDASRTEYLRAEPSGIRVRPPGRVVWGEQAERVELLGWDVPETVRRGKPFEMVFYFRAQATMDRPWAVFVHIDGDRARHLADHEPLGGTCPTSAWQPGDVLVDRVTTTIAATVPAGRFGIWIGFYTGWAPNWRNFGVNSAPAGVEDSKGRIKIADLIVE